MHRKSSFRQGSIAVNGYVDRHRIKVTWTLLIVWLLFGGVVLSSLEQSVEKETLNSYCEEQSKLESVMDASAKLQLGNALMSLTESGFCAVPTCMNASNMSVSSDASRLLISNSSDGDNGNNTGDGDGRFAERTNTAINKLIHADDSNWGIRGATFFCLTSITTIGYGNYTPRTFLGRYFTVVYTFFGILLFFHANFSLTLMAERESTKLCLHWFGDILKEQHKASSPKKNKESEKEGVDMASPAFAKLVQRMMVTIELVLLSIWWIAMAAAYSWLEGWSFFDGVYFSFCTLTTIGFGDFAPRVSRDNPVNYVFICGGLFLASVFIQTITKPTGQKLFEQAQRAEEAVAGGTCCRKARRRLRLDVKLLLLFLYTMVGSAMFRAIESDGESLSLSMFVDTVGDVMTGNLTTEMADELGVGEAASSVVNGDLVSGINMDSIGKSMSLNLSAVDDLVYELRQAQNCPGSRDTVREGATWGLLRGAMFSATIFTTVGYGDIAPLTRGGKMLVMIYFFPGVWLFSVTSFELSKRLNHKILKSVLRKLHNHPCLDETRYRSQDGSNGSGYTPWRIRAIRFTRQHLHVLSAAGFMLFFIGTSGIIFAYTEGWRLGEAMWFAFVTASTIGYGDYVPSYTGGVLIWMLQTWTMIVGVSLWSLIFSVWRSSVDFHISEWDESDEKGAARIGVDEEAIAKTSKVKKVVI